MKRLGQLALLVLCILIFGSYVATSQMLPKPCQYLIIYPENKSVNVGDCVNITIKTLANTTLGVVPISTRVNLNTTLGWFETANTTGQKTIEVLTDRNGTAIVRLCSSQPGIAKIRAQYYLGYNMTEIEFVQIPNVTETTPQTITTTTTIPVTTETTTTVTTTTVTTVVPTTSTIATVVTTTPVITETITTETTLTTTTEKITTTPKQTGYIPGFEAFLAILVLLLLFVLRKN